ncbi:MAG: YIP1 family protein [Chloroflexi bacterium]|nr:YIP1 family protein [Chloroflexota bacterium]
MLFERMMRAARLDSNLYEEVEADRSLTSQAATVVAIVAVCQGIGSGIRAANTPGGGNAIGALVGALIGAFVGWVIWSYITYWIGTSMFHGTATPGELLRTLGFAQTPGVLGILGFIPFLGGVLGFAGAVLSLVAGIVAIRQALDVTTGKAVLTALVGWLALMLITIVIGAITGGLGLLTGIIR